MVGCAKKALSVACIVAVSDQGGSVPTQFYTSQGMGDSLQHEIQESVEDFTSEINAALDNKYKFVTVTGVDGKKYSVEAAKVGGIKET